MIYDKQIGCIRKGPGRELTNGELKARAMLQESRQCCKDNYCRYGNSGKPNRRI